MRHKRGLSLLLALCMLTALTAAPVSAAYKDTADHWAKSYIDDVSAQGVFKGYEDNTFRPYNNLTAAEALVLCGRVCGVSSANALSIRTRWESTLNSVLGTSYDWARTELSVCLETGVLTVEELRALHSAAALGKEMAKEDLAMYLVRAMGLTELASGLSGYSLDFNDLSSISESRRPYVYILKLYEIVEGDKQNNFSPKLAVNRGVVATMLSRVLAFMRANNVTVELPEYTAYSWTAGSIAAVTPGDKGAVVLSLQSDLSGLKSVTVPTGASVYRYNMLSGTSALQPGLYARVAQDSAGTATSVRLFGGLQTLSGTVNAFTRESVTITAGGQTRTLPITRLTEVQAGKKTGDRSVIDLDGSYVTADCTLDASGGLLTLRLGGGSYLEEGILSGVETSGSAATLAVTGYDGVTRRIPLSPGTVVTVNNLTGAVSKSYIGSFVSLRIANDTGAVLSAAFDTATRYVQGGVSSILLSKTPNLMGITDFVTGRSASYTVSPGASITYAGAKAAIKDVKVNWFVTARLDSTGALAEIIANPGSAVTEGELTNITYGTTVVLEVPDAGGVKSTFDLDVAKLPTFKRDDKSSSLDKLRVGDTVRVTVRFNAVTLVESSTREANLKGTITRIVQEGTGSTLEVELEDGTTATYAVTSGVSITSGGKAVAVSALKVGYRLSMLVSGEQLISIEVDSAASAADRIAGTVLFVNTTERTILLQTAEGEIVTIATGANTQLITVTGGTFTLRTLAGEAGKAEIEAYGQYDGLEFKASLVLKK